MKLNQKCYFRVQLFKKRSVKHMKKLFFVLTSFILFVSCSKNDRGELIGVKSNKFFPTQPNGMVLIPSGSFTMGPSNPNAALDQNPTLKTVSWNMLTSTYIC